MSKTILIVEDNQDSSDIFVFALRDAGFETLTATDGYKAIEIVKEKRPDLILMDASLPLMDGITATRLIRTLQDDELAGLPIICVTGHGLYYQQKALEANCNEVLIKPIEPSVLISTITRYLSLFTIAANIYSHFII
jgi:CheY-like chemotaxis protein